ncbi:hypothetical protein ACWC0A_31705 [Streptomyces scopuliridis]
MKRVRLNDAGWCRSRDPAGFRLVVALADRPPRPLAERAMLQQGQWCDVDAQLDPEDALLQSSGRLSSARLRRADCAALPLVEPGAAATIAAARRPPPRAGRRRAQAAAARRPPRRRGLGPGYQGIRTGR